MTLARIRAHFAQFAVALTVTSLLSVASAVPAGATTLAAGFTETKITGLTSPTAMAFAPDGRLFVAQKTGKVRVIKNGVLLATSFISLTVDAQGERGVIGVAFHPDFPTVNRVYVHYTVPGSTGVAPHNRVSWWAASGDVKIGGEHIVVDLPDLSAKNHNGGAIHFGADGQLLIAVGENGVSTNSQSLSTPLGKVLRVTPDGAPSAGNPFADDSGPNDDRIWTLGLRNPFTFAVQPGTGTVHVNDVGSGGTGSCGTGAWEEINVGAAGKNYGWPTVEGPADASCPHPGFEPPLYAYSHSDPGSPCAIAGGDFYNPSTPILGAGFVGAYFFADLCGGWIRYRLTGGSIGELASGIDRPVDLRTGPDGALWYLAIGAGIVGRIAPQAAPPPKRLLIRNMATSGSAEKEFKYGEASDRMLFCDWDGNGTDTPGAFRDGTFRLRNSNTTGPPESTVDFGAAGDFPVCGKWQGGALGTPDTIGVFRAGTFYLRNTNTSGAADMVIAFGTSGDIPVVGDWNADGKDTIGARRGTQFLLRNSNIAGSPNITVTYGRSTDIPVVGDWNGDGKDTIGVRRSNQFLLRNSNSAGSPAVTATFGFASDVPLKGDFDRSGNTNRGDGFALFR